MAVDTKAKRASVLYFNKYGPMASVVSSGSFDGNKRASILWSYAGNITPVVTTLLKALMWFRK